MCIDKSVKRSKCLVSRPDISRPGFTGTKKIVRKKKPYGLWLIASGARRLQKAPLLAARPEGRRGTYTQTHSEGPCRGGSERISTHVCREGGSADKQGVREGKSYLPFVSQPLSDTRFQRFLRCKSVFLNSKCQIGEFHAG